MKVFFFGKHLTQQKDGEKVKKDAVEILSSSYRCKTIGMYIRHRSKILHSNTFKSPFSLFWHHTHYLLCAKLFISLKSFFVKNGPRFSRAGGMLGEGVYFLENFRRVGKFIDFVLLQRQIFKISRLI